MNDLPEAPSLPKLHCLGGQAVPVEIVLDLERLRRLTPSARHHLWDALGPALPEPLSPRLDPLMDAFCAQHGLSPDDLGGALRGCRFLVREASRRGIGRDLFAQDLAKLWPGDQEIVGALLRGFEVGRDQVRRELLLRSITAHGKVLVGVEWRMDLIAASNHATAFQAPIAMLTLRYEADGKQETITLQALPEALRKLQEGCKQLLG